ncbi:MAG: potassium transporter Kup [Rhodospirillaceae bacterium]|nr:potassium transporter Kup [Rhodospirillaceae bacterium]
MSVSAGLSAQPHDLGAAPAASSSAYAKLCLGALGVVYGDIGTSPLYAIKECFGGAVPFTPTPEHVLGLLSLVFWTLTIIVTVKYVSLIMRADNGGEGGSLALLALVGERVRGTRIAGPVAAIGIFAAALFFGDCMLTPAISVLSAVEGLEIAAPVFGHYVVPLTLAVLAVLFAVQKFGTGAVGALFGPVMLLWFLTIGVLGAAQVAAHPGVLAAVNPAHAIQFLGHEGWRGFLALAAVFLAVTGAEALYADMGHFGRQSIRAAWLAVAMPALLINYFGQGALLLGDPGTVDNPFYRMTPDWAALPMVILATLATVIASQAVISGAFSLTRQAIQLGYLPRMRIVHTSTHARGQVYVPVVNWGLLAAIVLLVLGFQSSSNLASAYGLAVSGTMLTSTVLFGLVMALIWRAGVARTVVLVGALLAVDLAFVAANATKVSHGGWFPLAVGLIAFVVFTTWKRGRALLLRSVEADAMPVDDFLKSLSDRAARVTGTAVYMTVSDGGVPRALLHNLKHNKVIHERVVFLTVITEDRPAVPDAERISVQPLGCRFYRATVRYGFMDSPDLPAALAASRPIAFDLMDTSFFLNRETILPSKKPGMALWREHLFAWMSRNAATAMDFFRIPPGRVVELGSQVEI